MSDRPDNEPLFRVVRGTPTPEELAALVGVIVARSRPTGTASRPRSLWVRHARPGAVAHSGLPARPGTGAWRASALPR